MAKNNNLTDFVTDIANHIRGKLGVTGKINPQNFSDYIKTMPHLVDISDIVPELAVNIVKGDAGDADVAFDFPNDFPWKVLPNGESFLPVVVFHAVVSYQFSEVVSGNPGTLGIYDESYNNAVTEISVEGGDTVLHTSSAWWGVVYPPIGIVTPYHACIAYDNGDPVAGKFTASIKVTPYILKIGDRVLSLRTCKGEA